MYEFNTTEQNLGKANDFETKAMLYLMSFRADSKNITIFFIDCFNDTTGADDDILSLWDVQAKNVSSLRPKTIGECLITLFQNYISEIDFFEYILFIPKLKEVYLKNEELLEFKVDNFKENYKENIIIGLETEYIRRNKDRVLKDSDLRIKIEEFIEIVMFVVGKKEKAIYINNIINFKSHNKGEHFYNLIFDEIRNKQAELKNINIHKFTVEKASEVIKFNKYITRKQLEMLIINRIIGIELFTSSRIPNDFYDELVNMNKVERKEIIQECNANISKLFFDKNSQKKELFWSLLEEILICVEVYPDIRDVLGKVKCNNIPKFIDDEFTLLYLISMVKEGFEENDSKKNWIW